MLWIVGYLSVALGVYSFVVDRYGKRHGATLFSIGCNLSRWRDGSLRYPHLAAAHGCDCWPYSYALATALFWPIAPLVALTWPVPEPKEEDMPKASHTMTIQLTPTGFYFGTAPAAPAKPKPPLPVRQSTRPIRAWRRWRLTFRNGEPFIQSLVRDDVWEGPILRASEKPGDHTPIGDPNHADHGIYAWPITWVEDVSEKRTTAWATGVIAFGAWGTTGGEPGWHVEGEVELLGRVVRHERGYRAESARVCRLLLRTLDARHDRLVVMEALERRYQCEVGWRPAVDVEAIMAAPGPEDDDEDCECDCCCEDEEDVTSEFLWTPPRGKRGHRSTD